MVAGFLFDDQVSANNKQSDGGHFLQRQHYYLRFDHHRVLRLRCREGSTSSATNIYNPGTMEVGAKWLIQITSHNADFTRSL